MFALKLMRFRTLSTYRAANLFGISYTLIVVCLVIGVVLLYVCPATYGEGQCGREYLLAAFIFFEITSNLFLFQFYSRWNNPQTWAKQLIMDGASLPGDSRGKFCIICNRMAPERSHHCPLCEICVLRRDHHCFMTGACVGIANQRFFIVFVWWTGCGAGIGAYYLLMYLIQILNTPLLPFGFTKIIAPVALTRWLSGYEPFIVFVMSILFCIAMASSVASFVFFFMQIFYTLNGFTMYDYHKLDRRFELKGDGDSYGQRLDLVFGKYWLLNFIFPQVWFPNRLTPEIATNIFNSCAKDL